MSGTLDRKGVPHLTVMEKDSYRQEVSHEAPVATAVMPIFIPPTGPKETATAHRSWQKGMPIVSTVIRQIEAATPLPEVVLTATPGFIPTD